MLELRPSAERGLARLGWLQSRHSFSFGSYYDPEQVGFSDLLVINDDRVQPGRGFDTHGHRDMEIFTYVLEGALAHKDSMGTGTVIRHSEFNASSQEPVHFLQIWIIPNRQGVTPRYQQQRFEAAEKRGTLRLILSPQGEEGSLQLHQDARVYAGLFDGQEQQTLTLAENRHAYVHVVRGALAVNGQRLEAGDGARLRNARAISFGEGEQAEVLVFDLRPVELPSY